MLKKILRVAVVLISIIYADTDVSKTGCILAQKGNVIVSWQDNSSVGGVFDKVVYIPIKYEGSNFKQILVGSKIKIKDKNITLKIVDIKANKRVKPHPRSGTLIIQIIADGKTKNIYMNYTYSKNIMNAVGIVDILNLNTISFKMKIEAILCSA